MTAAKGKRSPQERGAPPKGRNPANGNPRGQNGATGFDLKGRQREASKAPEGKLGRIYNLTDLKALPKPEPLITDWLDRRTAVVMPGATGTNKTFTLVGWACSTATGEPWLGHEVCIEPSPAILVIGEGAFGLLSRFEAWQEHHGVEIPPDRVITMMQPNSLKDSGFWNELTDYATDLGAQFIAFDTLSSLGPDLDETKDSAQVIRRISELSVAIDGTTVLSHHTGWGPQDRARGGSQFEANPDGVIVLSKADPDDEESPVSLWRKKVKDGPSGRKLWVRRLPVGESCVLEVCDEPAKGKTGRRGIPLEGRFLNLLRDEPYVHTKSEARKEVGGNREANGNAWDLLVENRMVISKKVPDKRAPVWAVNPKPPVKLADWSDSVDR